MTTPEPIEDQRHALYRFYTDTGTLLYVGITNNPDRRFAQHAERKAWWSDVRGISIEWYDSRSAVLQAERRAVQTEQPVHNDRLRTRRPPATTRPATTTERLAWVCNACQRPIIDGQGYLTVDMRAVRDVEDCWNDFDTQHAMGFLMSDFLALPKPVPWIALHHTCDPDPDAGSYWFNVARARTHAQLLDWTAHLMTKDWLRYTDWADLIRNRAGVDA